MGFGHNNVGGGRAGLKEACAMRPNASRFNPEIEKLIAEHGRRGTHLSVRLLNDDLLPVCGKFTVGKYYDVEAELPDDKILIADDRGIKMIVLGWGFKQV